MKIIYEFNDDEFNDDIFEYEPLTEEIKQCAKFLFADTNPSEVFDDIDLYDYISKHEEVLKEILKDWCKDTAYELYSDMKEEQRDPYAYRGIKRNDFF